ncbi:hypothetical protein NIES3974_30700 [Calothrix sp. NIES-3974]|nr:hypothetical protein NIES3974_30700 [Calothrix sp. NIES-3974]
MEMIIVLVEQKPAFLVQKSIFGNTQGFILEK